MKVKRAVCSGLLAATVAALALLAAGCGGGSPDSSSSEVASLDDGSDGAAAATTSGSTSSADDSQEAFLDFAQCMRDNGVDVPDPTFDSNGNPQIQGGGGQQFDQDDPDFQAAMEECGDLLQGAVGGQFSEEDQQEFQANLLEFAQCMRDNGVDVEDPDFSQGGPGQGGGGIFGDLDQNDPEVQAAMEACQEKLGDLGPPGGPGGQQDDGADGQAARGA